MIGTPLLRPTVPCDDAALIALTDGTGVFKPHEIETLAEVLDDYHRDGAVYGHDCRTLLVDGEIVGFAYAAPVAMTDRTWELWWIAVRADSHGRGLGRWLLDRIEQLAIQQTARLLLIETSSLPTYESTRQFYLKRGYRHLATLPDYYSDGDDKVIFGKRFSSMPC